MGDEWGSFDKTTFMFGLLQSYSFYSTLFHRGKFFVQVLLNPPGHFSIDSALQFLWTSIETVSGLFFAVSNSNFLKRYSHKMSVLYRNPRRFIALLFLMNPQNKTIMYSAGGF